MARCTGVFVVEQHYLRLSMDMCVNLPLIVTLVIALELQSVLQAVVTHSAIQDCLDLILLLAIDQSCGWGWCRTSAWDGIWMHNRQFDHGEHGVMQWKWGGRARRYAPRPMHASTTKGPKCQWDNLDDGLLVAISLPSSQTLSPGLKIGAGSRQRL
jgi:hypothetical protein